jgi:diguanylate cyclase (GGDEF)-like protein
MALREWDDELREVSVEFLDSGAERVGTLRSLVDVLRADPGDRAALGELRRLFHSLKGAGATLGFPAISDAARRAEQACLAAEQEPGPVSEQVLADWTVVVNTLGGEFGRARDRLPAGAGPAPGRAPGPPTPRRGAVHIVDDDDAVCEGLRRRLTQEGFSVQTVATAAEARALWAKGLPDAIVVDVQLPDERGYALVEWLRGQPGGEAPAVLMLSLLGDFLDRTEAIHAGADASFEKPVEWDLVVRRLHHLVERAPADVPRILVVEDDPSHGAQARSILEAAGYEVRICDQPRQFSEVMAAFRPDMILMDIVLPDVSGYDLARYVRQEDQHLTLPILFLTGDAEIPARIETVRSGGDDFLAKPVHPSLLVASVAARLERARLLRMLLNRDGLTRLLTHTSFMEQAQGVAAHKRRREGEPASLAMIDLDHFKAVNDTFGHQAGDRVLVSLSGLLRRHLRRSDIVGRYGGEEFGILLDELAEREAVRLITRLLHEFATVEQRAPGGAVFHCTFSAGVAGFDRHSMDLERWIRAADGALYAAKRAGRNRVIAHAEWLASLRPAQTA